MKYFCVVPEYSGSGTSSSSSGGGSDGCTAYSIGSFDMWDFEKEFLLNSNCSVNTYDCTTAGKGIPKQIQHR